MTSRVLAALRNLREGEALREARSAARTTRLAAGSSAEAAVLHERASCSRREIAAAWAPDAGAAVAAGALRAAASWRQGLALRVEALVEEGAWHRAEANRLTAVAARERAASAWHRGRAAALERILERQRRVARMRRRAAADRDVEACLTSGPRSGRAPPCTGR